MGRLARSWGLFKTSLGVIKQDKELLWLPILSAIATVLAIAAVAGLSFPFWPQLLDDAGNLQPAALGIVFLLYILLAFVAAFFHGATIAGANERLAGGDPTLGSALKAAARSAGRLLVWSIVVATVNVILQALRERAGFIGQIFAGIAGFAWNLATYFVVPYLVVERDPVRSAIKDSAGAFRRTWGETVVGEVGIGFVFGLLMIPAIGLGFVITMLGFPLLGVIVGVSLAGFLAVFQYTVAGVYKTALWRYATTGEAGGGFTMDQLAGAYHTR